MTSTERTKLFNRLAVAEEARNYWAGQVVVSLEKKNNWHKEVVKINTLLSDDKADE